jgi:pyruvate/2-oxoglutarate dehydrogenase complex dihydrolipoamide acyltransferase (E2) component
MALHVLIPRLSQDMTQWRIVEWLKKEGEAVREGEPLVSIESDKAEVELQAPQSGILRRVLVAAPPSLPSGEMMATPTPATPGKRQPISPAARGVARELGVEISQVVGSGAGGRGRRGRPGDPAHRPPPSYRGMGLIQSAHGGGRHDGDRCGHEQSGRSPETHGLLVHRVRCLGGGPGLARVPHSECVPGREPDPGQERHSHRGGRGADQSLVVAVVRSADRNSVAEISREIDELATRARNGQLTPDELKGSTFTVTNSGAFGSLLFTPIINQPEVAILAMGKVADTPVAREGQVVVRKVMYLCLSYDHRVVDGIPAVQFLQAVKRRLE